MGKTRLLNRLLETVQKAKQESCHIIIINFQNDLDSTTFKNYEEFLKVFCNLISKRLQLPDYWDKKGSGNNKATGYFSGYLLPKIENQLILVLEEMDRVFEYPLISQDFCQLLRGFHEKSQRDELFYKMSLVIVHSTDKYATLDIEMSPLYNVGTTVVIEEFTREQVEDLAKKYQLSLTFEEIEQIMILLEGHPLLVNHTFQKMAKESFKFEEILGIAATQQGIYHEHLLRLWNILKSKPHLTKAFVNIINSSTTILLDPEVAFQLERLGLIRIRGNLSEPRCQLYRQYFSTYYRKEGK